MYTDTKTQSSLCDLACDQKGSVFIEMLFFLPVALTLWSLLGYTYDSKKSAIETQRTARECAWEYAMSGCEGDLPPECLNGGLEPIDDQLIRSYSDGSFEELATLLPLLAPNLEGLHGRRFTMSAEATTTRPVFIGGSTTAAGVFSLPCVDALPPALTPADISKYVCEQHGVPAWCDQEIPF